MNEIVRARLDARGRVTLPRVVRDHLEVGAGDMVVFRISGQTVIVESMAQLKARILRGVPNEPDVV